MKQTIYITSQIDNQSYCKTNGQFTRHLRKHNLTYKDYYEIYETQITPLCGCLKPLTFYQKTESYANSCGDVVCVGKSVSITKQAWIEEQRQQDSKNKKLSAAQKTSEQIAAQVEKSRKIFKEKYGVEWATQSEEYKQKSRQTKLERYGNEYYAGWEKSTEKNRNKSIQEQDKINDKRRSTNLERYGVENVFLKHGNNSKVNKGNSSIKEYKLPSGKIIGIRGYENLVLNELLKEYDESKLQIHDDLREYVIERFEYQSVDRKRLYYPDIYIPSENLIIEVKSVWWWNGNLDPGYRSRLINNLQKRQAVINNGYRFQLWLFENKYTYRILENDADFQREQEKFKSINA
jgi:hypothetical protein